MAYWSSTWKLPPERLRERVAELAVDAVRDALADDVEAHETGRRH